MPQAKAARDSKLVIAMHEFAQTVAHLVTPLTVSAQAVADCFARIAATKLGLFGLAAAVITSLALAAGCGSWAIAERNRAAGRIGRLSRALRQTQATLHFRNALLHALPEALVVMPTASRGLLHFHGGKALLAHCLDGPDAVALAEAIEQLRSRGRKFHLQVRTIGLRKISVRGLPVGDAAALFLDGDDVTNQTKEDVQVDRMNLVPAAERDEPVCGSERTDQNEGESGGTILVGADGRLKKYDPWFAKHWALSDDELRREPEVKDLASLCRKKSGRDAIWSLVTSAIASREPERHGNWGPEIGADGRRIAVSFSRQSDGATLVSFGDAKPSLQALGASC